jgi:hypothetical protein
MRFPHFYPQRPDIVEQLEQLASNLGGQLRIPDLPGNMLGSRKSSVGNWRKRLNSSRKDERKIY